MWLPTRLGSVLLSYWVWRFVMVDNVTSSFLSFSYHKIMFTLIWTFGGCGRESGKGRGEGDRNK